jgi:hypothetical protein
MLSAFSEAADPTSFVSASNIAFEVIVFLAHGGGRPAAKLAVGFV